MPGGRRLQRCRVHVCAAEERDPRRKSGVVTDKSEAPSFEDLVDSLWEACPLRTRPPSRLRCLPQSRLALWRKSF